VKLATRQSPELRQFHRFHRLGNRAWLRVLLDSVDGKAKLPMPGFPPAETQAGFIGSSGRQAILEAWRFYLLIAAERRRLGPALGPDSHVLDFGCGWGRLARMFLRDVPEDNIWCADPLAEAIDACRAAAVPGHLVRLGQLPPSELPSAQFNTVSAYSVFSHLSPTAHRAWREELARVTTPGALLFITTQGRWFLDQCQSLRDDPSKVTTAWEKKLAVSFIDHPGALAEYDGGGFLYAATGGGPTLPPELYGQAVVPRSYFAQEWGEQFEFLDFIANTARCPQAVAVMRRRG
jgi:SAM-dependent methyltransferase